MEKLLESVLIWIFEALFFVLTWNYVLPNIMWQMFGISVMGIDYWMALQIVWTLSALSTPLRNMRVKKD